MIIPEVKFNFRGRIRFRFMATTCFCFVRLRVMVRDIFLLWIKLRSTIIYIAIEG